MIYEKCKINHRKWKITNAPRTSCSGDASSLSPSVALMARSPSRLPRSSDAPSSRTPNRGRDYFCTIFPGKDHTAAALAIHMTFPSPSSTIFAFKI